MAKWVKFMNQKEEIKARDEIRKRLETQVAAEICGYLPMSVREVC